MQRPARILNDESIMNPMFIKGNGNITVVDDSTSMESLNFDIEFMLDMGVTEISINHRYGGISVEVFFANGYGVLIVRNGCSDGANQGLFSAFALVGDSDNYDYLEDYKVGEYLIAKDVFIYMSRISQLTPPCLE